MPRKVFVAGSILTAADVNTNLMDQAVMSFAGTAARGSAIPSPVEGMVTYLQDTNGVAIYDGSAWKRVLNTTGSILQVVSAARTSDFTTSSTSFVDMTDVTLSITPSSTSSKIMLFGLIPAVTTVVSAETYVQIVRDSTALFVPAIHGDSVTGYFGSQVVTFLDSPSTVSATTYKIQVRTTTSTISFKGGSITAMEVAG